MLSKWRIAMVAMLLLAYIWAPAHASSSRTLVIKARVAPHAAFAWDQPAAELSVVLTEDTMIWPSFTVTTNTPVRIQLESVGYGNQLLNESVRYQVFDRPDIPSIEPDLSFPTRTDPFQGGEGETFALTNNMKYYGWFNVRLLGTALANEYWWELPAEAHEDSIVATVLLP
jgi:hypothetical protein